MSLFGGRLNENLVAILIVALAIYLNSAALPHADILREIIYVYLGFLVGKRYNPQERRQ